MSSVSTTLLYGRATKDDPRIPSEHLTTGPGGGQKAES